MIVGRSAELAVVTAGLDAISSSGTALVVEGEAGIGKSTLLAAAADWASAHGFARLGCSGLQSQTEIGFAGAHELIHPLLGHADQLPRRQRNALMTAFGLEGGPAPDRLLVCLAVLGLLEEAATRRRLLLVIDDVQWLDQSSLDVLAFVARRLTNAPLMMLYAERTGLDGPVPQLDGLARLPLGPLLPAAARELLAATLRTVPRDDYLQQRVLGQANGNPLAVIELANALGERGRDAAIFAGEPLPTTRRVERAFLAQLDALSEDSRLLLLLIAASGGSLPEVSAAAAHIGLDFGAHLAPLERASLVTVGGGRVQVRHPLIRSTVYGAAPLASRTLVHRALATCADDPTKAAWHRAEATFTPDEHVAAELERAAERARGRGAGAEAAAALRRAAVLSVTAGNRVRRLAHAAEVARSAGQTAEALRILAEAEPIAHELCEAEPLAITRFVLNVTAAIPGQAADDLVALAMKFPDGDPQQRELLWAAAIECRMHGLAHRPRQEVLSAITRLDDIEGDPLAGVALALVDDTGKGLAVRARLPRLIDAAGDDPLLLMALAFTAEALADREHAMQCWTRVGSLSRHRGSPANECETLRGSSQLLVLTGRIQAAAIAAQSSLQMADDMNLPMTAGSAAAILARALTLQGHPDRARQALEQARCRLAPDPQILWHDDAHWAAGMAALCTANHMEAVRHFRKMTLHRTSRRWAIADLAEAAEGCGQTEGIGSLVDDAEAQANRLGAGLDIMLAQRAQALLAASDDEAEQRFLAALAVGADADAELELARTDLLYGEWLRRRRRIVEARTHLSGALTAFDGAGAAPFVERARAELRAAGVTGTHHTARKPLAESLTSQELQIAQLAASGLTNREIADRIYLSHKTVAAHLYKVFPKLGITTRSQLHAALGEPVI